MVGFSGENGGRDAETVIAKASLWPIRILLLVLVAPIALWSLGQQSIVGVLAFLMIAALAVAIDLRVGGMRLAVRTGRVDVVNFLSSHSFDIHNVRIETKTEESHWPADDIPTSMNSGSAEVPEIGSLHLSDGSGNRIRVGVLPSYGKRVGIAVEDLKIAIAKHRL